jgi:hypothetical protein
MSFPLFSALCVKFAVAVSTGLCGGLVLFYSSFAEWIRVGVIVASSPLARFSICFYLVVA